jgi:F0F1-type ATP synthase delta subunit
MTAKDYAKALYAALKGKTGHDVEAGVKRLTDALTARGMARLLPQILAALPAAADEAEAPNRVTIEVPRKLAALDLEQVVRAAGANPETADVRQTVRPELIGGARIKKHGVTIDASVKGKLERISKALSRRNG